VVGNFRFDENSRIERLPFYTAAFHRTDVLKSAQTVFDERIALLAPTSNK
jgi:hypothetical protein